MTRQQLIQQIKEKRNYLCIGLDTDVDKIPRHLLSSDDPVFEFNKAIIDATKDYCVSYKINTAFYEAMGVTGWQALQKTVDYIPSTHFKIADAKRGDIGNTSAQYAKAFFEVYRFDAVTVAPYMGEDSIKPFLEYKDKWTIILGLTSNEGSKNFEQLLVRTESEAFIDEIKVGQQAERKYLYEAVLEKAAVWGIPANTMFVIGATKSELLAELRQKYPEHFFLVPGVGAQGGSLEEVSKAGLTRDCGLLVNISRAIIYAGKDEGFAEAASIVAKQYAEEMAAYL